MPNTRRYTITLTDTESREVVIFTDAHWTTEQRQMAVGTILRLAGVPDEITGARPPPPRSKDRNA
jgi:hypothetical protein